ncbi:SMI1/KNR4 family protein [Rossellomorea vietnamensis]|uniref:SMI1/KNR4 family protein n=1 Tax=Rossellomorea vietnamensis TaxID=218284 RepID=UPI001E303417|nr:SMI1/KNR4 family protein [Rossellomorea vietnamensis]MCC5803761.1 SMI1/KNR4 family protein [Rossellomorea vietnamensis]
MDERISMMIENYGEEGDFFGEVPEEYIHMAEKRLGVRFPRGYRDFVKKYGSGGICGVELEGVQGNLGASVVIATERWRKLGLSSNLIVLEDSGEFARCMYCADTNDVRVFSWERAGTDLHPRYHTFEDYVIDIFQEGISNW